MLRALPAMMRGVSNGNNNINFSVGASNAKYYSGHDRTSTDIVPTFGATNNGDMTIESNADSQETVDSPKQPAEQHFFDWRFPERNWREIVAFGAQPNFYSCRLGFPNGLPIGRDLPPLNP